MKTKFLTVNLLYFLIAVLIASVTFFSINRVNLFNRHKVVLAEIKKNASETLFYEKEYIENLSDFYLSRYTMTINSLTVKFKELKTAFPDEAGDINVTLHLIDDHMSSFFAVSDSVKEDLDKGFSEKELAYLLKLAKEEITERHDDFYNSLMKINKKINKRIDTRISNINNAIKIMFGFLAVLIVAVALFVSRITTRGIVQPMIKLAEKMKLFGDNPQKDIIRNTRRSDEIGDLVNMFLSMANSIVDYSSNLEDKVHRRTEELEHAMEELEATNEHLKEARDAIWGEMELAKKIQTVLLPQNPQLEGYDIVASLDPADEVGGDYYDVISIGGCHWLVIGDVSGHGVTAGLIMMMAQTAIHTVLHDNPGIPPIRLLAAVNKSITENIKLLGEFKYMTITIFALDGNSMFTFCGLHQDILVYRYKTGMVEVVETSGIWLGIEPHMYKNNVYENQEVGQLEMFPGDCMVLYTDGVTEAMDKNGKMFGNESLEKLIAAKGNLPAQEIHNEVLDAIEDLLKIDDVTLVVIKRRL
ncbi:MAG: SpoIIE family protein phosphatase [bacterium]|nr:SpoIIE family protein phosphatase [bacterium]